MVEWNESLSIGIPSVDVQHQELVKAFNELEDAMRRGKGSEQILPTLRFLGEYALKHFATEEALMRMYGYPGLGVHRAAHEAFRADFGRIQKETESATYRAATTLAVSRRLLDWLFTHIQHVDKEMGVFLAARGVR